MNITGTSHCAPRPALISIQSMTPPAIGPAINQYQLAPRSWNNGVWVVVSGIVCTGVDRVEPGVGTWTGRPVPARDQKDYGQQPQHRQGQEQKRDDKHTERQRQRNR